MQTWYIFSILAFVSWGLWAFFIKLVEKHFSVSNIFFWYGLFYFIFTFILSFLFLKNEINRNIFNIWIIFIVIAGLAASLANFFFYYALSKGNASIIVPLTALYPLITIILSLVILKEKVTFYQTIGIILALIAGVLLSI